MPMVDKLEALMRETLEKSGKYSNITLLEQYSDFQ